jgi:hypothetical protein
MNLNSSARHRTLVATCVAAVLMIGIINISSAKEDSGQRGGESYTIGLFGDTPYNAGRSTRVCSRTSTRATSPSWSSMATSRLAATGRHRCDADDLEP